MAQSRSSLSIFISTQGPRIGEDLLQSADGQDDYGMGGELSPESQCSFGMSGSPSPAAEDFGMGGSPPPTARSDFGMGGSPSPTAQCDFGMGLPPPTAAREPFGSPSAARVWEWGKRPPSTSASELPQGPNVVNSEALQEVGDQDGFSIDRPPLPMAQDQSGMDLPTSPRVRGLGAGAALSQQDGLPEEGFGTDLALPTEGGEPVEIPSAAHSENWGGYAPSPGNSQLSEGQGRRIQEVLQVQAQHPPVRQAELAPQEEFDVSTQVAILRAEGSRLRRIHSQIWYIYEEEKEMSEMIDEVIEELDDAEIINVKALDQTKYECAWKSSLVKSVSTAGRRRTTNENCWVHSSGTCQGHSYTPWPIQVCRQHTDISLSEEYAQEDNGQYNLVGRMCASAQWANTSFAADYVYERHGPMQARRQILHMGTIGQYKLVGRMHKIRIRLPWANTSPSADYSHGHNGQIQNRWQNTCMGIMGQCQLVEMVLTWAPWANTTSSSADFANGRNGPIQEFWQDMQMGTMGQYNLVGEIPRLAPGAIQAHWQDVQAGTIGQYKLFGRIRI
ncbi:hypothetical protein EDB85DRAFT_1891344 [Lactarius pseudohatsudake]|nr:hypothetical protein EDB85DRAFT_1891344 [Lactarius pseudohatsudake]